MTWPGGQALPVVFVLDVPAPEPPEVDVVVPVEFPLLGMGMGVATGAEEPELAPLDDDAQVALPLASQRLKLFVSMSWV